jgi:hypothetical protein
MSLLKQIGSSTRVEPESVRKIFEVPAGFKRGILMLTREQLKTTYSKINGYNDFVDSLSEKEMMVLTTDDAFFKITEEFSLDIVKESFKSDREVCVLLNIDEKTISKLNEQDIDSMGAVRGFLRTVLNHKFYVGVLNARAIVNENATRDKFAPSRLVESVSIISTERVKTVETSAPVVQTTVEPINTKLAEKITAMIPVEEPSKKKWIFTVNRNQSGLIESIEVTEH